MEEPNVITGGQFKDNRGRLSFVNDFDMTQVRRFYMIEHDNVEFIRGWRAHKTEQRWFYVSQGCFKIKLVKIDHWIEPNIALDQLEFILNEINSQILHIPKGYASSLQALEENSKLIVFADFGIDNAQNDDYLFPADYFKS